MSGQDSRQVSGPLLLVIGISILGVSDSLVLIVSESASVGQFHFIRSIFIALGIFLVARRLGLSILPKRWVVMLVRTGCMVIAILLYFTAMPLMPMAEAGAGLFTSPIFVLLFSVVFLKETIGLRQLIIMAVGILGVLLILLPNMGQLTIFHFFPVGAGAMYAVASMLTFRYLSDESPLAILVLFMIGIGICGGIITTVFSVFPVTPALLEKARFLFYPWVRVDTYYFGWVGIIALFSALALGCITRAYQITKTSQIAIYEYAYLASVGISNYIIWNAIPTPLGMLGISLIIITGLVISQYHQRSEIEHV